MEQLIREQEEHFSQLEEKLTESQDKVIRKLIVSDKIYDEVKEALNGVKKWTGYETEEFDHIFNIVKNDIFLDNSFPLQKEIHLLIKTPIVYFYFLYL